MIIYLCDKCKKEFEEVELAHWILKNPYLMNKLNVNDILMFFHLCRLCFDQLEEWLEIKK